MTPHAALVARIGGDWSGLRKALFLSLAATKKWAMRMSVIGGIAAAALSIKWGLALEKSMAQVHTLLDVGQRKMHALTLEVLAMSAATGQNTASLSKGLYDIVSAQISVKDSTEVLRIATDAATAGATNTAVAVKGIVSVVQGYGAALGRNLSVTQRARKASDIFFMTIKRGITTFAELAPTIGRITPVAALAGVSFTEVGAALATMTRSGLQTGMSIIYLRQLIAAVLKPTKGATFEAERLGLNFSISAIKAKGFAGFLKDVAQKTKGSAISLIKLFGNVRSFTAAAIIAGTKAKEYAKDLVYMKNSTGAAAAATEKMTATAGYQLKKLWATIKGFATAFGMGMIRPLTEVMKKYFGVTNSTKTMKAAFDKAMAAGTVFMQKVINLVEKLIYLLQKAAKIYHTITAPLRWLESAKAAVGLKSTKEQLASMGIGGGTSMKKAVSTKKEKIKPEWQKQGWEKVSGVGKASKHDPGWQKGWERVRAKPYQPGEKTKGGGDMKLTTIIVNIGNKQVSKIVLAEAEKQEKRKINIRG